MSRDRRASFVVRAVQDPRGEVSGVIERVATGAKEAFTGMEAIGRIIARMLQGEDAVPPTGAAMPAASETGPDKQPRSGSVRGRAADERP